VGCIKRHISTRNGRKKRQLPVNTQAPPLRDTVLPPRDQPPWVYIVPFDTSWQ